VVRVLLIDNVDSFTFNVADLVHRVLGGAPTVWGHQHLATTEDLFGFDAIVVGPGPGRPQHPADMGLSDLALRQGRVPVLGVCLGHQGMAHLAGEQVVELAEPMHGRVSTVSHHGTGLFEGVPSPLQAVRYHSLEVRIAPDSPVQPVAWAEDDGCVMALADPAGRRWGVQFHPESVLSEHGALILANFLRLAGVGVPRTPAQDHGPVAVGDVLEVRRSQVSPPRAVGLQVCSMPAKVDTWRLHARLVGAAPTAFWLDSSAGSQQGAASVPAARVSVIGDAGGPLALHVTHRVGQGTTIRRTAEASQPQQGSPSELLPGRLLDNLGTLLARWQVNDDLDLPFGFRPGFVGYLGYELKAETGGRQAHRSPHPDGWLVLADRVVVVDHHADTVHALYLCDDEVRAEQLAWVERVAEVVRSVVGGLRHTESDYLDLVGQCQRQIRAGESYEICLTNRVSWPGTVDEAQAYRLLREASPVPFGAWLRGPGLSVLGASPERFVSLAPSGLVEARPIKGTRPRDADPTRDAALAAELVSSVKDRAENLMIVDLLRNDLHRVCRSGTVHVPDLFAVESYATVHQLVSTIRGQLADGMGALDVIGSCFPGGSMTGAPKVRTMEILDGLEGGPRGAYSGALGWIGLNGAMDLSIVIRTATSVDGRVEFGIGGAITSLSEPAEEFAETLHKAGAMAATLTAAGEVEFTEGDVRWLLDLAAGCGVDLVLDGGWAVDAHLGSQTRRHADVDVVLRWSHLDALVASLEAHGFVPVPRGDTRPWNFVLGDAAGRFVDLHVYRAGPDGAGHYGAPGAEQDVFPAEALAGRGRIGGREVAAIAPQALVGFKSGYAVDADDWHDVELLCAAYGLQIPADYDRFRH
jgi:para-aminobenzoate synthetase